MRAPLGAILLITLLAAHAPAEPRPVRAFALEIREERPGRFIFRLSDRLTYIGLVQRRGEPLTNSRSWSGRLENTAGSFTLVEYRNQRFLRIHVPDKVFEIVPPDTGTGLVLTEIDARTVPECTTQRPPQPGVISAAAIDPCSAASAAVSVDASTSATACDKTREGARVTITALVLYTKAARSTIPSGLAAIRGLALINVDETNEAFARSNVRATLRMATTSELVGRQERVTPCMYEVGYSESGALGTDLDRLIKPTDGELDSVHGMRDRCRADVVLLIVARGDGGGRACVMESLSASYAPHAFGVVLKRSSSGNYAFTHEIGHMMGAGHDRDNGGPGMCSYSSGWRFRSGPLLHKSMMAYRPGLKSLNFSDPEINYTEGGQATGARNANNARTLRVSALTVSNFR